MTERERLNKKWREFYAYERRLWRAFFIAAAVVSILFLASIPILVKM